MKKLSECREGEVVTVVSIDGRCLALRLESIGLRIGDKIKIFSKISDGPIVIEHTFHGNKIVIGRGMSGKIYVANDCSGGSTK